MDWKARNEELAKLLNLEICDQHNYDHGVSLKLNEYQSIFVRFYGAKGGKGLAQLQPSRKVNLMNNLYIDHNESHREIGFAANKSPKAIAQDVTRRLLKEEYLQETHDYIKERVTQHLDHQAKAKNRGEFLQSLGFRLSESSDDADLYYNGQWIDASRTNNKITIQVGDNEEQLREIIAMVAAKMFPQKAVA